MNFALHLSQKLAVAALAFAAVLAPSLHAQVSPARSSGNGTYIQSDPLAGVRYDNKYDVSVGMAYAHIKAGPNILQGANLGGYDVSGSWWFLRRLALEGSARGYFGTTGTSPATANNDIHGAYISQQMYLAGPEFLGPHNKHGDVILHALVGAAHGNFTSDLPASTGDTPNYAVAGLFNTQTTLGGAFGGHLDLNRSPRLVFRISPDALLTTYDPYGNGSHQQWQFGISVGAEYKFSKKR